MGHNPEAEHRPAARPHRPKKIPPTPEQIAKIAVKRRKVIGTDRVEVTFGFTLSRATMMERLTAPVIREGRSLESVVAQMLGAQ